MEFEMLVTYLLCEIADSSTIELDAVEYYLLSGVISSDELPLFFYNAAETSSTCDYAYDVTITTSPSNSDVNIEYDRINNYFTIESEELDLSGETDEVTIEIAMSDSTLKNLYQYIYREQPPSTYFTFSLSYTICQPTSINFTTPPVNIQTQAGLDINATTVFALDYSPVCDEEVGNPVVVYYDYTPSDLTWLFFNETSLQFTVAGEFVDSS